MLSLVNRHGGHRPSSSHIVWVGTGSSYLCLCICSFAVPFLNSKGEGLCSAGSTSLKIAVTVVLESRSFSSLEILVLNVLAVAGMQEYQESLTALLISR